MTAAQNTSNSAEVCGSVCHTHTAEAAFARMKASTKVSLPCLLSIPEISPESAYDIVKNGMPPRARSIATPKTQPTVQP